MTTIVDLLGVRDEWQDRAVCAQTDPEAYFPEKGQSTRSAKATCKVCEVQPQCLDYAMTRNEPFGVWGGLSERERRKLRLTVAVEPVADLGGVA